MFLRFILSFIFIFSFFITAADAGPPFLSDDTGTPDYQTYEYYGFMSSTDNPTGAVYSVPAIEVDYGLLSNVEISAIFPYISNDLNDLPKTKGIGDLTLGLKYRFYANETIGVELAFSPNYTVPTGDAQKNIGNGRGWGLLPIWGHKVLGLWDFYGGGGYAINGAPGMLNYWYGGIVSQKTVTQNLMLGFEVFAQGASQVNLGSFTVINLGGQYSITPNFALLGSMGNNIGGVRNFITYAGFIITT